MDLYAKLAEIHGHYCPMSTLGLRLGLEAARLVTVTSQADWNFCYLARTCAADGIAMALGETERSIEFSVDPQGQHLLVCRSVDGKELSLALSAEALQLAKDYHGFDDDGKSRQLHLLRTIASERLIDMSGPTENV
ncbi:FmdE family protein [Malonomonas rubra]|uniref:FmdE family protein n=1 Tax=Malonomonas rubra TaxID=57040 RepID=UPI0026F0C8D3|nr:FmdE family protein [Malonomonas rubra]